MGVSHFFPSDGGYDGYKGVGGRLKLSREMCHYAYKGRVSESQGTTVGVHRRTEEVLTMWAIRVQAVDGGVHPYPNGGGHKTHRSDL